MYLDRDKEYFYTAYLSDAGGQYNFQLGLFGRKTSHTESTTSKAKNEKQRIKIESLHLPQIQVDIYL